MYFTLAPCHRPLQNHTKNRAYALGSSVSRCLFFIRFLRNVFSFLKCPERLMG